MLRIQVLEPQAHDAITTSVSNSCSSCSKYSQCLLTNDLSLSTIDVHSHQATLLLSEIGCHRDRPQLHATIRSDVHSSAIG
jgi:predicted DCC family thiol-disulfide oxidoreductase YuxK